MSANTLPPELRALAPAFADRAACLLAGLCALVAARFLRHFTLQPILNPLWRRIHHAERRIAHLMSRLAAGRSFACRATRARAHPPAQPAPAPPAREAPRPVFPRTRGWLLAELRHEAAFYRNRLESLLAQPGMTELLRHSPGTLRLLRPIGRMLALDLPAIPRPPRALAGPAPPSGAAAPAARPAADPPYQGRRERRGAGRFPFGQRPLHPLIPFARKPA